MTEKLITRKNRERNDALSKKPSKTKARNVIDRAYVRYYLQLDYIFDPAEIRFISHIVQIQFISSLGYKTNWSKNFMMERMDLGITIFNRCEKKLVGLKLLERKSIGKKISYNWNEELFERLVSIVNSSQDIFAVKEFCKTKFIAQKRGIDEITEKEIDLLKSAKWSKRKW